MGSGSIQGLEIVFLLLLLFVVAFGITGAETPDSVSDRPGTGWADPEFYPGHSQDHAESGRDFFVVLPPLLLARHGLPIGVNFLTTW